MHFVYFSVSDNNVLPGGEIFLPRLNFSGTRLGKFPLKFFAEYISSPVILRFQYFYFRGWGMPQDSHSARNQTQMLVIQIAYCKYEIFLIERTTRRDIQSNDQTIILSVLIPKQCGANHDFYNIPANSRHGTYPPYFSSTLACSADRELNHVSDMTKSFRNTQAASQTLSLVMRLTFY